jgi:CDP-glycerol glycerophosphotransferase (TagB/SpsB family)
VTDHSSVGFEYLLLDRPLVVIDCPELVEQAGVNRQKVELLRGAAAVVRTAGETAMAVREGLDRPGALSGRRRAVAAALFDEPGGATARAVRCLYDLLSLPQPEPDVVRAPRALAPAFTKLART